MIEMMKLMGLLESKNFLLFLHGEKDYLRSREGTRNPQPLPPLPMIMIMIILIAHNLSSFHPGSFFIFAFGLNEEPLRLTRTGTRTRTVTSGGRVVTSFGHDGVPPFFGARFRSGRLVLGEARRVETE
mmetsp:Transcript_14280/g.40540  ORF Transcript_14280/g.40540 Transcript_14280/m.40540 type:complete len:128 (+) Transcript_14280:610-993(+)